MTVLETVEYCSPIVWATSESGVVAAQSGSVAALSLSGGLAPPSLPQFPTMVISYIQNTRRHIIISIVKL